MNYRLSDKLETLLLMAVRNSGSYNPDKTLLFIEESLTEEEYALAQKFLDWIFQEGRTFGSGNIQAQFRSFKSMEVSQ